jgi:hypothetical protein
LKRQVESWQGRNLARAFNEDRVKRLLNIPAKMKVTAILPIGVPDEKPEARPRKDFSEIIFKEQWKTI